MNFKFYDAANAFDVFIKSLSLGNLVLSTGCYSCHYSIPIDNIPVFLKNGTHRVQISNKKEIDFKSRN